MNVLREKFVAKVHDCLIWLIQQKGHTSQTHASIWLLCPCTNFPSLDCWRLCRWCKRRDVLQDLHEIVILFEALSTWSWLTLHYGQAVLNFLALCVSITDSTNGQHHIIIFKFLLVWALQQWVYGAGTPQIQSTTAVLLLVLPNDGPQATSRC